MNFGHRAAVARVRVGGFPVQALDERRTRRVVYGVRDDRRKLVGRGDGSAFRYFADMKVVVRVKLLPDACQAPALRATLRAVNEATGVCPGSTTPGRCPSGRPRGD